MKNIRVKVTIEETVYPSKVKHYSYHGFYLMSFIETDLVYLDHDLDTYESDDYWLQSLDETQYFSSALYIDLFLPQYFEKDFLALLMQKLNADFSENEVSEKELLEISNQIIKAMKSPLVFFNRGKLYKDIVIRIAKHLTYDDLQNIEQAVNLKLSQ